ncbi:MAG: hypothetical protein K4445_12075 [Deltaproteobacteria bacterium]|jgi:hypothetical protein
MKKKGGCPAEFRKKTMLKFLKNRKDAAFKRARLADPAEDLLDGPLPAG